MEHDWIWPAYALGWAGVGGAIFAAMRAQHLARRVRKLTKRLDNALAVQDQLHRQTAQLRVREAMQLAGRQPRLDVVFRSQYGEDAFLYELFDGKLDGFYIEAGAYDGKQLAVTWAFEAMGWTGLLVEPLPERSRECAAHRPGSRVVQCALTPDGSKTSITLSMPIDQGGVGMLSSTRPDEHQRQRMLKESGAINEITVPARTLTSVLDEAPPKAGIDFFVLDVEGTELDVLAGLDLNKYRPAVMLIEVNTPAADEALKPVLERMGYRSPGLLPYNRVAIDAKREDLWERARRWFA